ncbi:hypothetical protein [Pedobacter sp. SG908]|uniref:hypothetical protein n=1 Tax=Pedobacter sp. SG908 TaxID=2587135 RepID=UPI001423116F|nr:hypothetical protein [Pedobacter sp. SG908]NII85674.1 hypothetical protein [Pedobacter sp. SG908]
MTDEERRELGIMTETELDDMNKRLERTEESGISDTQKYFDRIHDKLFSLNSLLIGGYFALIAIRKDVPNWSIIVPLINSGFLLLIDYRMMVRARIQASITTADEKQREKYGTIINNTNLFSLLSIYSSIAVVVIFVYYILS